MTQPANPYLEEALAHLDIATTTDSVPRRDRHTQLAIAAAAIAQASATERMYDALVRNTEALLVSIGGVEGIPVDESVGTRRPRR